MVSLLSAAKDSSNHDDAPVPAGVRHAPRQVPADTSSPTVAAPSSEAVWRSPSRGQPVDDSSALPVQGSATTSSAAAPSVPALGKSSSSRPSLKTDSIGSREGQASSPRREQHRSQQQQQQQQQQQEQHRHQEQEKQEDGNEVAGSPIPAIDPLSQHIFKRTNTDHSIPQRLRNPQRTNSSISALPRHGSDISTKVPPAGDASKDKKKGSSFLSRLSMRGSKKKDAGDVDSDSEFGGDMRSDGATARVFSQVFSAPGAGGGFIPHHKEPPRYIRTKSHNKKKREFSRMFLAQELIGTRPATSEGKEDGAKDTTPSVTTTIAAPGGGRKATKTGGAIWAADFSKDGKYLATAGRDRVVRVWAVISTPDERRAQEEEEIANGGGEGERLSAPVFRDKPYREFTGHTGEILDLSWSKNNFLLSSSMDKTVRLWHISRDECLCTFKHKDFVTRLAFHPRDDRFFLAGSLDTMLRLWSIPDKAVAYYAQLPELITAVAFSPDGKTAIAGLLNGLCLFYDTDGLKLKSQVHVRSSRGKNAKGSKITGIQTMAMMPQTSPVSAQGRTFGSVPSRASSRLTGGDDVKVLITSNDSRIRIYNLRDKTLDVKLKGHENACSQIAAAFSDDGKYVVCGSEDRKAFIWSLSNEDAENKDHRPYECFDAHGDIVTTAIFAPTKTRMLLGASGDPIYDLCNPPPVTLMSLEEAASVAASQTGHSADGEGGPESAPANGHVNTRRTEESPAYIARSTHYDGNIIVVADDTGIIKVFRQDCAYLKRKHDNWETSSTFRRAMGAHSNGFLSGSLRRSGSVVTRTSGGSVAHSRRASLSQPGGPSGHPSPHLGSIIHSNSDRILSWRQGIEGMGDRRASSIKSGGMPARSERSVSPNKTGRASLNSSAANLAARERQLPYTGSSPSAGRPANNLASPPSSVFSGTTADQSSIQRGSVDTQRRGKEKSKDAEETSMPPTPSFSFHPAQDDDPLRLDPAGASYSFWNLNRWRNIGALRSGHSPLSKTVSRNTESETGDGTRGEKGKDGDKARKDGRRSSLAPSALAVAGQTDGAAEEANTPNNTGYRQQSVPSFSGNVRSDGSSEGPARIPSISAPDGGVEERDHDHLSPPYAYPSSRGGSVISKLSSELSSELEEEEDDEEGEEKWADAEEMRCAKCGGQDFKAKLAGGRRQWICSRCGTART
ncbi:hypothetical protein VTK73DRAFT_3977 [Phialemonium thermophilum]|uniref:Uncharacterized protein n=1 Tax=Phialemonium thermophilum TaxID=223376 RepID=A0ABR3WVY1_9PEZI